MEQRRRHPTGNKVQRELTMRISALWAATALQRLHSAAATAISEMIYANTPSAAASIPSARKVKVGG